MNPCRGNGATGLRRAAPLIGLRGLFPFTVQPSLGWNTNETTRYSAVRGSRISPKCPNCLENFWMGKVSRGFVTDLTHHVQKLYFPLDTKCRSLRYVELIIIFGVVSVKWFFFSSLDHLSGRKSSRTAKGWILKYLHRIMLVGWDLECIVWQEDVKEEPDIRQGDDSLLCEFSR